MPVKTEMIVARITIVPRIECGLEKRPNPNFKEISKVCQIEITRVMRPAKI